MPVLYVIAVGILGVFISLGLGLYFVKVAWYADGETVAKAVGVAPPAGSAPSSSLQPLVLVGALAVVGLLLVEDSK
jgi:hypothetical protein